MKLGISSYTYTWAVGVPGQAPERPMRPADLLERAAGLGVRVLQIADNLPLHSLGTGELQSLDAQATALGIALELGTRGISVEHLAMYASLAAGLQASILRVVLDTPEHRPEEGEIITALRRLEPQLASMGVHLAIENHDRLPVRALARIVAAVGSPFVGICLDIANSFGALEGPEVVVQTLGPLALNLHVKGFSVRRANQQMGFVIEGCPLSRGQLSIPWLLAALRSQAGPQGGPLSYNAILEQWTPAEPTLAATIAKERVWAEESIALLRRLIQD
jgi:3-oxoisoapionate decarboxylase